MSRIRETFLSTNGQSYFNLSSAFITGTLIIAVDGITQMPGASNDFTEVAGSAIQLTYSLNANQNVVAYYQSTP